MAKVCVLSAWRQHCIAHASIYMQDSFASGLLFPQGANQIVAYRHLTPPQKYANPQTPDMQRPPNSSSTPIYTSNPAPASPNTTSQTSTLVRFSCLYNQTSEAVARASRSYICATLPAPSTPMSPQPVPLRQGRIEKQYPRQAHETCMRS